MTNALRQNHFHTKTIKHKKTTKKTNVGDASTSLNSNIQAAIKRQNERC